jgi:predicted nuclease of predicted toxin-antitoxin system
VNFLADESVDRQIVERLRAEGHSVPSVAEMEPGISDEVVLSHANRESVILLTADKDFGEMVYRLHRVALGVVLIRLVGLSPPKKA